MATNIDRLSFQMEADVSQFEQGMRLSRKELQEVNRAMRRAEEPAEKLAKDIDRLEKAVSAGGAGSEKYAERLERLRKKQSDMQAEQSGLNREMAEARKIIERTKTETERYNEEADRAAELMDKGHLSASQYRREIDRLEGEMGQVSKEQHEINDELQRAEAITRRVENASERYAREVADLNGLLQRGRISQKAYNRAVSQQSAELNRARASAAANIPVVGNMASGLLAGGAAMGAAAVATAGFTASLYALQRAASAVFDRVAEQMQEVDELAKQSRFLGLSANELQAFRLAGEELAGLDFRQVDVGLQRVVRRLSEAAAGTGEAKGALKELGVDASALAELPTGQALLKIADSLSNVKDEGERVRLAFKLLDAEGARLALAFANGSSSVEDFRDQVDELGLGVSELEQKQIEAANDALGRMGKATDGLARTLAVDFAPNIEAASGQLQGFVTELNDGTSQTNALINAFASLSADALGVGVFGEAANGISEWSAVLSKASVNLTGPLGSIVGDFISANEAIASQIEKDQQDAQGDEDQPQVGPSNEEMEQLASATEKIESMQATLAKLRGVESPIIDTNDVKMLEEAKRLTEEIERQKAINAADNRLDAMRQEARIMGMTADEAERYKFAIQGANEAQQAQFASLQRAQKQREKEVEEPEKEKADFESMMQQGQSLEEQFESPAKKLKQEIADLKKLRDVGAIETGTFEKAARQAAKEFQEATGRGQAMQSLGRPGAAEQGSQEALKAIQGIQDEEQQVKREQAARQKTMVEQNKIVITTLKSIDRQSRGKPALQGVG